jgi:hypothetical protein
MLDQGQNVLLQQPGQLLQRMQRILNKRIARITFHFGRGSVKCFVQFSLPWKAAVGAKNPSLTTIKQAQQVHAAGSGLCKKLSLYGPHRKPGDKPVQEKIVDERNRQAGYQAGSHQRAPEINVAPNEEDRNSHTHHLL